ncbi:FAD-dependent oxidoreductase [Aurantivibrio plasticivorans]
MKKTAIVLVIALLVAGFFYFDLQQLLTLAGLKDGLEEFQSWRAAQPLLVTGGFFLLYVVVAALSLPGAAVMTLAAGALFGLVLGTAIVSFASTVGATLAFLVSRYLLQKGVQQRFGERLATINEGVKRDGAFYLFTLRLVPVFPFFLINLLMGLTPIRTWTFYWVSQIGMFAGTLVYVNAGTQLGKLESLSGILSPALLFSFVLLGVFPLIAKKLLNTIKEKRVYAKYKKPKSFDRNMIVIGAGSGGLVASLIAATVKAKVTLIESNKMGGDCLNYGCVPSKALIKSAKVAQQMRNAEQYGLYSSQPSFSFRKVMQRINDVVKAIEPHDSVERYTGLGVDVVEGYGRLIDPWTVEVEKANGQKSRLTARSIVLATGARPFVPPLPGIESTGYVTSDTLWETFSELDAPPRRLVVLGGGPIGCELAQSFARLGSEVTQIEMAPRILIREDDDVAELAKESLEKDGIELLTGHKALRCGVTTSTDTHGNTTNKKFIVVEHQGKEKAIAFDYLLCAVGRSARLDGYGLESLGIETNRTIVTNDYLETLYPNIYACGDVAGPYQFTHTASHQAWYASVNALFGTFKKFKVDYRVIPWTTFLEPEIARVGLNEQEAKEKNIPYEVTTYGLYDLDRAIADSAAKGFVKVITPPGKDKILGVTIVGEHGGDLLAEFVLAMKHGLGLNKILGTIHTYPTWAEANKYVAGQWKQKHKPELILNWLNKYHSWRRGKSNETTATDQHHAAKLDDSTSSVG